jgi:hypothetical protein
MCPLRSICDRVEPLSTAKSAIPPKEELSSELLRRGHAAVESARQASLSRSQAISYAGFGQYKLRALGDRPVQRPQGAANALERVHDRVMVSAG